MGVREAFLLASGIAYLWILILPKPCTKQKSLVLERMGMAAAGMLILSNLLWLKLPLLWLAIGVLYVGACLFSYFGYVEWRVQWQKETSSGVQMAMWLWDLGIALCAFIMGGA